MRKISMLIVITLLLFFISSCAPKTKAVNVSELEVISGLKSEYVLGEAFDIGDLGLKVTYNNLATETLNADHSMLLCEEPTTDTAGKHHFTLIYKGFIKSFAYDVCEEEPANPEWLLYRSVMHFYDSLYNGEGSFIALTQQNANIVDRYNSVASDFFTYEVLNNVAYEWSHLRLLVESTNAIKASKEGKLGTEVFPDKLTDNFGKKAFCSYDAIENTFHVGYWATKLETVAYWFESYLSYDEETKSVRADIYFAIGDVLIYRCLIEYVKLNDGSYACFMYYPQNEGLDDGLYRAMLFRFNGINGDVALERWASRPDALYRNDYVPVDYAKQGDIVLSMSNNGATMDFIDHLGSPGYEFYLKFSTDSTTLPEGGLQDVYLRHMDAHDASGDFSPSDFSFTVSHLGVALWQLYLFENQIHSFERSGRDVTITRSGDTTWLVMRAEGLEDIVYTVKYTQDRLSVEYRCGEAYESDEIVKENNVYYIQRIIYDHYEESLSKKIYQVYQAKYVNLNNMVLTKSTHVDKMMPSIYWAIPGGFAEAGEYKYILENDVYQYLHG